MVLDGFQEGIPIARQSCISSYPIWYKREKWVDHARWLNSITVLGKRFMEEKVQHIYGVLGTLIKHGGMA